MRETEAGFVRFEVQLRPEEAAVVRRALEAATERAWDRADVPAETPPASLRRADALVAVADVLDVGRRRRTIPTLLRRALRLRDRGCRFPGCTNRLVDGLEPDGAGGFRFFRRNGREVTAAGAAPVLPAEPVEALRTQHRAEGLAIDAWTGFPRWDGQPPDYEHAVFCLAQLEAHPSPCNRPCASAALSPAGLLEDTLGVPPLGAPAPCCRPAAGSPTSCS